MATKSKQSYAAEEAEAAYSIFYEEALREPIKYLKHDARAHDDEALYRLANRHGMAYYGLYWLLAELLTGRKDHSYDVSDEAGWRRLAWDLSCMELIDVDDCKAFVAELAALDLISREQLNEMQKVVITRIRLDANAYAERTASKKLGAWKTNRNRLYGS